MPAAQAAVLGGKAGHGEHLLALHRTQDHLQQRQRDLPRGAGTTEGTARALKATTRHYDLQPSKKSYSKNLFFL